MAENKMADVAAIFNKEPGEEFRLVMPSGKIKECKFTADRGLLYYDRIAREWLKNYAYLDWLSTGRAVIVDE